ncbi:MAG: hypothetical protein SFV18_16645 [Bryobacteraceae bacterium]|nr:hypothetical protein [Bryobacteraceae bacterium]
MRTFVGILFATAIGQAAVITDTAIGGIPTFTVAAPAMIAIGDVEYAKGSLGGNDTVGEGIDDEIRIAFDFTGQADLAVLQAALTLTSATLNLKIVPQDGFVSTDTIQLNNLAPINSPLIQSLAVGVPAEVTIDLLTFYTPAEIIGRLNAQGGLVGALFQDDSFLTEATLTITGPDALVVPEAATWAMVALILAAFALLRRRV